jgi:hypothetical protein
VATLVFRLRRGGKVRMLVIQAGCGPIASFTFHGHPGVNRVRIGRRIDGRRLPDGTYRIRGRSHGRTVVRAALVVGRGGHRPCALALIATRLHDVFGGGPKGTGAGSGDASPGASAAGSGSSASKRGSDKAAVRAKPGSGLLAAQASKVLPGKGTTQIALALVLAAAALLLALGAFPRELVPHGAVGGFLARRRAGIAGAGLAMLAAVVISYFIT